MAVQAPDDNAIPINTLADRPIMKAWRAYADIIEKALVAERRRAHDLANRAMVAECRLEVLRLLAGQALADLEFGLVFIGRHDAGRADAIAGRLPALREALREGGPDAAAPILTPPPPEDQS